MNDLTAATMRLAGINETMIRAMTQQLKPPPQPLPSSQSKSPAGGGSNPLTELLTGSSGLGGIISKASASILAILAPVALFSSAMNSQISGMSVFMKTLQLVTTIMGGMFLPAFMAAGAIMLSIADYLKQFIGGQEQLGLFKFILDDVNRTLAVTNLLFNLHNKGLELVISGMAGLSRAIASLIQMVLDQMTVISKTLIGAGLEKYVQMLNSQAEYLESKAQKLQQGDQKANAVGTPAQNGQQNPNAPKGLFNFVDNLKLLMTEMQRSISPPAQITGIAQARDNAQLAAFNQSEIDRKMLEIMLLQLNAMQEVVRNIRPIGA